MSRSIEPPVLLTLRLSSTLSPDKTDTFSGTHAGQERDGNSLKMKFCWCPRGRFTMGSPPGETNRNDEEQVQVNISRGFWLGKFEATQGEWTRIMDSQPWAGEE